MKDIKFYSIGRGNLNIDGKFYYGLDYAITDFINSLEQENKKYKEVIDNIKCYLEDSANQMSEEATYTLMYFIKEVE